MLIYLLFLIIKNIYRNVISVNTYFVAWRYKTAFIAAPSVKCTSSWRYVTLYMAYLKTAKWWVIIPECQWCMFSIFYHGYCQCCSVTDTMCMVPVDLMFHLLLWQYHPHYCTPSGTNGINCFKKQVWKQ